MLRRWSLRQLHLILLSLLVFDEEWVDVVLTDGTFAEQAVAIFLGEKEEASPAEWHGWYQ